MALLFMDSFDHYSTTEMLAKWTGKSGSPSINASAGRRASQCMRTLSGVDEAWITLAPANNGVVIGAAISNSLVQLQELLVVRKGSTEQFSLCMNASGALELHRGNRLGTLLATSSSSALFSVNTFYYFEVKAVVSTTVGTCTVRLNGANVAGLTGLTGLNNAGAGTSDWDQYYVFGRTSNTMDIDDLYVLDTSGAAPLNDFLGDIRVDARMPTAEGATAAWTPLSGTDNALMVDEIPPNGDTDYNSTTTVGAVDTLVTQDAPVAGATILGVQTNIYAKKTDTGTVSIAPVIRSGTDQVGTTVNLTTSYVYTRQEYPTNPATGVAWTEAGFNAAEFGYKRIA